MIWQLIFAGFALGLVSSLHCIGMCGPIALGIPVYQLNPFNRNLSLLLYNFGRTITYSCLGMMAGIFGQAVSIAGYQQSLSIVVGIMIILTVVLQYSRKKNFQPGFLPALFNWIESTMAKLLRSKSKSNYLLIGIVNGLLPCGMVYIALAAALTYNNGFRGTFFMAMFGLGTIPLMLAFSIIGFHVSFNLRNQIKKYLPVLSAIIGTALIVRGLGLGIPGLSPQLQLVFHQISHCF